MNEKTVSVSLVPNATEGTWERLKRLSDFLDEHYPGISPERYEQIMVAAFTDDVTWSIKTEDE